MSALVLATLAVAEQQRIANVIAISGQRRIDTGLYKTIDTGAWDQETVLADEIREGLGL